MPKDNGDKELKSDPDAASVAALELAKQLLTLASGVIALSATFIDKIRPSHTGVLVLLIAAWVALVLSVIAALDHISTIVQSRLKPENHWYEKRGKKAAWVSKWCFVIGITLFGAVAVASLFNRATEAVGASSTTITQQR